MCQIAQTLLFCVDSVSGNCYNIYNILVQICRARGHEVASYMVICKWLTKPAILAAS